MTSNSEDTLTADLKSYSNITDKLRQLTPDSDWVFNFPFWAYFFLLKSRLSLLWLRHEFMFCSKFWKKALCFTFTIKTPYFDNDEVYKVLTKSFHYMRKIEQNDRERIGALSDATQLIGQRWLRDIDDTNIKAQMKTIWSKQVITNISYII